jgi:hypothetical protein
MDLFLHRWSDSNWAQIGREQLDSLDPSATLSAIHASRRFLRQLLSALEEEDLSPELLEELHTSGKNARKKIVRVREECHVELSFAISALNGLLHLTTRWLLSFPQDDFTEEHLQRDWWPQMSTLLAPMRSRWPPQERSPDSGGPASDHAPEEELGEGFDSEGDYCDVDHDDASPYDLAPDDFDEDHMF